MGIFSKVWKGLKKGVKKIGKGIKKVFTKVTGAIGKLGIVGQIGMMLLMPYATGALTSFFGASGTLSGWATGLMKSANIGGQALGHTLNLVQKSAAFVGKVYTGITETISGALDKTGNFLKGRGFVSTPVVDPNILSQGLSSGQSTIGESAGKIIGKDGKVIMDTGFDKAGFNRKALSDVQTNFKSFTPTTSKNLLDLATEDFVKALTPSPTNISTLAFEQGLGVNVSSLLDVKTKTPSFLENINIFDKDSAIRTDISDFDAYDYGKKAITTAATDSVLGGAQAAGSQKIAEALGYKQITPTSYSVNLDNAMGSGSNYNEIIDSIDFATKPTGNSFYASNIANSNYLNNIIMPQNEDYQTYMSMWSAGINQAEQQQQVYG